MHAGVCEAEKKLKRYPILNVAAADVQRANRAAANPLQTQLRQLLTVAQVQMLQTAQPDEETDESQTNCVPERTCQ